MGRKRIPGLRERAGIWHIEKQIFGRKIHESTGTGELKTAELGTLRPFIEARQAGRIKHKSINLALSVVRRILNLAARLWRDETGKTWLETAPLIQLLPTTDARKPYPLSWEEQATLFQALPTHLARMCLFKVNTGCREQEVCGLRWEWEIKVPELDTSVFIIPGTNVKN